jgi:hypothetical protein
MVRVRAFGLRIGLRHVRPSLGLAVIVRPIAMVDVARRVHPHQTRSASSRLGPRRSLGRRRGLSRRCSSRSRRHRRWCSSRSRLRCRRWSRCRSSWSRRLRSRGSIRRIPLLHTLVSAARARLLRCRGIRPVLTLPGRASRGLSYRCLCHQQTSRKRNETNRFIHKFSKNNQICRKLLLRTPPNPTLSRPTCHQKAERAYRKRPFCNPNE